MHESTSFTNESFSLPDDGLIRVSQPLWCENSSTVRLDARRWQIAGGWYKL
jgi:hypothetical protein